MGIGLGGIAGSKAFKKYTLSDRMRRRFANIDATDDVGQQWSPTGRVGILDTQNGEIYLGNYVPDPSDHPYSASHAQYARKIYGSVPESKIRNTGPRDGYRPTYENLRGFNLYKPSPNTADIGFTSVTLNGLHNPRRRTDNSEIAWLGSSTERYSIWLALNNAGIRSIPNTRNASTRNYTYMDKLVALLLRAPFP